MTAWTAATAPTEHLRELEGVPVYGDIVVRTLVHTPHQLVLEVLMGAGARSTAHAHPCDSAGVLLSGRVRAWLDGEESVLEPGDGYHHPEGVVHHVEALEDSRLIEIKSPPTRPW